MRKWLIMSFALVTVLTAAGCGNKNETNTTGASTDSTNTTKNDAKGDNTAAASKEVKKVVIGTGTQFPQVCFIDKDGKLTGFDVELIREIDKRLPNYEFDIQTMEFTNLLLSLETKKIDLVAHEMEKNPEREQKYLFNKEPYAHWKNKIIVAKDNSSVNSIEDLKGKKVLTSATSAEAQILENYNKEHDNALKIIYQNGGANDTVSQLTTGRVDATVGADFSLSLIDPEGKLKTVGKELSEADILFVLRKDDPAEQELADAVDGAVKELKADGTLGKLSKQWLGQDFTAE
ncbi:L-cystine-binding protein TcyK [Paenibacillus baekrokdamisoli]|uniref:L-cystine-binding protein TcyK n=1 Tax=Paenibacillus baekrokdamisoli TaxID=1712516 RepID=A0A3G9IZJ4_9BACL|nr:transporter substrate-binding domain-containing protein [Paenibacillus baekrokdamisoli]MBB3071156.1 L-cystine transport system substrate-binding protein [Paenibacillus baekrokdamisoli]BBH21575.1 L-cystine-binding protein TcyK [Paenibacillus baekrokdamisoli]